MKLAIRICATASYTYLLKHVIRRIVCASAHRDDVLFIYVSDQSEECEKATKMLREEIPEGWAFEHRALKVTEPAKDDKKYSRDAQLLIARLHGEGFDVARKAGADQCWTIEPDVLVPRDALRMMEWALAMPGGYYDGAFCTYPNGQFIGGFGDYAHPIAEDCTPEERELPEELQKRYDELKAEESAFIAEKKMPSPEWREKQQKIAEEIKQCPPKGNVFELNAKKFRRRGWMDSAYPGIGRGAIVPVDWGGEGCNLYSKRMLEVADYHGYAGEGTQDLWLFWRRFHPNGFRTACITHTVCDHVKRTKVFLPAQGPAEKGKEFPIKVEVEQMTHFQAMHEQLGEMKGHLRVVQTKWEDL